jgi:partner of Y14 and mago protein
MLFWCIQFKQGMPTVPPGYDPDEVAKPKTKAAKKNEKRKEKKQQVLYF